MFLVLTKYPPYVSFLIIGPTARNRETPGTSSFINLVSNLFFLYKFG